MAESKTEKKEQAERLATEAQWKLCQQLYDETNYFRQYDYASFMELAREDASKHIAKVKEEKVCDSALRAANQQVPQFDKIGFGMVYKLVWKACSETPMAMKPGQEGFTDMVIGEYKVFKAAQAQCSEFVKDGGLK